jgi:hypothetical protein
MVLTDMIRKILPKRKTDTKTEQTETDTASEKWLQALALLFQACEPLTHDCMFTKEEVKERDRSIERHTFYCLHVKMAIEDGVEPLSWDDWNDIEKRFKVEAQAFTKKVEELVPTPKVDPINVQEFGNQLTKMFEGKL